MCGAFAMRPPSAPKSAHEKSRRSWEGKSFILKFAKSNLDIRANGGSLKNSPHLLGDGHEAMGED